MKAPKKRMLSGESAAPAPAARQGKTQRPAPKAVRAARSSEPAASSRAQPSPAVQKLDSKPETKPDLPHKTPPKKAPTHIPSVLLEGDTSPTVSRSGPGDRFVLSPVDPVTTAPPAPTLADLPEGYGTKRLFLTARDPHWLYAAWDLSSEQRRDYNSRASHGHLVLRVFENTVPGEPITEVHVHPESASWFVHVPHAEGRYAAELGYFSHQGNWSTIATSRFTLTPPDSLSQDTSTEFATLPTDLTFDRLLEVVKTAAADSVPLLTAIRQLREQGHLRLPITAPPHPGQWTPEQAQALARIVSMDQVRRVWIGSLEITELIRRHLRQEISSQAAAQFAPTGAGELGLGAGLGSISSPFGKPEAARGFWFSVNAELVIYGATEPDASVSIGGKSIKLRPDGSFSFRFALPDGDYGLPVIAVSPDKVEARLANLAFRRTTEYRGDVGLHPQEATLRPPAPENL